VERTLWRPFRTIRVTFGRPIADAGEHDLPAELLAFWAEHGRLEGAEAAGTLEGRPTETTR
jgi:hypothetical protein